MVKRPRCLACRTLSQGVGSEWSFQFSLTVQIARCQTAHLALLIFSELGQKWLFPATDLEGHPLHCPLWLEGDITKNVLVAGATLSRDERLLQSGIAIG
jgi:hypothetical protein